MHATLDSVRADLSSRFGLSPTARYTNVGVLGGSIASKWEAELQVQYAPEVAVGGVTPNGSTIFARH
jgi:hypothetical protein